MKAIILERSKVKVFGKQGKVLPKGMEEEHTSFLHSILSNDIKGMRENTLSYNLWLKQNGAPIRDLFVYKIDNYYILDSHEEAQRLIEELSKLKLSLRVYFEALSLSHVFIFGEGSEEFIREKLGVELRNMEVIQLDSLILAKNPIRIREVGFDLIAPEERLRSLISGLELITPQEFEDLRIEKGIPAIGKELREGFSPLEAGVLSYAISLTKGCYVGQEAIARVYYRGRTPRSLAKFSVKGVREGDKIKGDDRDIGIITSVHSKGELALGYVLRDKMKEGEERPCGEGSALLLELLS